MGRERQRQAPGLVAYNGVFREVGEAVLNGKQPYIALSQAQE
jgi:hypothetical protein